MSEEGSERIQRRNNTGTLLLNTFKTNHRHPHMRGSCKVDGKDYDFAAWNVDPDGKPLVDKRGNAYMSVTFSKPYRKGEDGKPKPQQEGDDIPF